MVRTLITQKATTVNEDESIGSIARKIVEDPKTQTVYVVNKKNELVGIIPVNEILQYLYYEDIPVEFITYSFPLSYGNEVCARDMMMPPTYVKDNESLSDAFRVMFEHKLMELPVVDENMHVIGDLNAMELIEAWLSRNRHAH
jgi:CBS domain-containing protein